MKTGAKIAIGAVAIGLLAVVATAMSHRARPKAQIRQDAGGYYWAIVDSDGTVTAQTEMRFATEAEALSAAGSATAS